MNQIHKINETQEVLQRNGKKYYENDDISSSEQNKNDETKTDSTTIYIVFISLLLDLLAFTMILPLFSSLLEFYRINDDKTGLYNSLSKAIKTFQYFVGAPEKYNSVLFGGCLGSMFSFLQYVASPIVGGLSDVYGRKPLMIICTVKIILSQSFIKFK